MADKEIKEGDQVSWQWSGSRPGGEVAEVKDQGKVEIETKRGNTVHKNAEPDNPAVKISRSGNDVVKKASELKVDKEGDKHKEAPGDEKTVSKDEAEKSDKKDDEKKKENGDAETGDKRKAEDTAEEKKDEEDGDAKKQKKDNGASKANGDAAPKKKGRPAKSANGETAAKKDTKKKEPKKAATESGEPRRSGRNASK
ncbi:hypothetical protein TI39_contig323g00032 [Zymoseptoria brevis]|uniref:Hypervirulence associated protein TUDOR domain-containing protein n=1 Tax=Zymoseptoria brevis TaxID=1047168 RepID=A0A0F4GSX5_9PEZI|nr:hypothetical protein TI39_contig323g00032 [Zymoseptoria brevis]